MQYHLIRTKKVVIKNNLKTYERSETNLDTIKFVKKITLEENEMFHAF